MMYLEIPKEEERTDEVKAIIGRTLLLPRNSLISISPIEIVLPRIVIIIIICRKTVGVASRNVSEAKLMK